MIIGHEEIIADLTSLIESERLGHGYVFFGSSMVGKRSVASALAHLLEKKNFEIPSTNEVLQDGLLIDQSFIKQLNPDTKDSVGIDVVREIKNFLWQKPIASPRRTLIIDDAERMTTEAQNALLKVAEEPPASSLLILVTSDIESIMPTILSRLPKVYFGTVPEKAIEKWLVSEEKLTKPKAAELATKSVGKPGLAWRLLHDRTLEKQLEEAQAFLKTTGPARRDFIKKLLEPEDFNLRIFLEAVIMNLAWEKASIKRAPLWHKTLSLYENATNFGLNPRLQLENLLR